tara:strand:+ start:1255 stop:1470 length:216 start_codon:yes stop_codon:yes gene_type:complete
MSSEKVIYNEKKNLAAMISPKVNEKISSGRVDINDLIARVRLEKQKENKTNMIFVSLIVFLVVIVGTILSF